jgi:integrase
VGLRKRGKYWFVDVYDATGRRIRKSVGTTKAVAKLVEKDLIVKVAKKEYLGIFEENTVPFSAYAKQWLEKKKVTVSQSTCRDYRSTMEVYAIPHFRDTPLCQVTRRDVEDLQEKLGTLTGKRKNNIMVPVKALFNDAKRRGDIKENPAELIRRFKEEKPLIDPLSFPEMKLFLAHLEPHYVSYFTTAFLTGMRPNEMLALKWQHVDFEMRCITVREGRVQGIEGPPKTLSSYRDVDLLGPLFSVIAQLRTDSPSEARYVFTTPKGKPLNVDNLRHRVWYPTLENAGLRKRTMYQTRHTFASLMLSHGEDPMWVARMLGHTSLHMIFRHYGKFVRNRSRKDGARFLIGLEEAGVVTAMGTQNAVAMPAKPLPVPGGERVETEDGKKVGKDRHTLGTLCKFVAKKGATVARNPL